MRFCLQLGKPSCDVIMVIIISLEGNPMPNLGLKRSEGLPFVGTSQSRAKMSVGTHITWGTPQLAESLYYNSKKGKAQATHPRPQTSTVKSSKTPIQGFLSAV